MNLNEIVKKVKEKGIKGCVESMKWHSANAVNNCLFYHYQKRPIDENLIVMESGGEITDNAYAFYDYMGRNGYLKKYHVVWLVYEITGPRKEHKIQHLYPNTKIVWGCMNGIHNNWDMYLATCKWYIFDHSNVFSFYRKRSEQCIINLWHGCGFKAPKGGDSQFPKTTSDINFMTGKLYENVFKKWFNCDDSKLLDIGYPRNDYLFETSNTNNQRFTIKYNLNSYNKVFLWMPTFRKSIRNALTEDYYASETGLPIINKIKDLVQLNSFLKSINSLCIIKIHHLQSETEAFHTKYDNINFFYDEDITEMGLQLYQIIALSDCLITDYSSVANDYMLLDHPIIFTVDDYEEYKKSRGFIPEDPIKYFAGACVTNTAELFQSIDDVSKGIDEYKSERQRILPFMHTHVDGNSSERIVDYLGLNKA